MPRKIKPKSTTINIIFSFSMCLFPLTYSSTTFSLSSLCPLSPMVELRRTSATTAMGFIFLRSCFMGFIFLWVWLWVHLISFVLVFDLVLIFCCSGYGFMFKINGFNFWFMFKIYGFMFKNYGFSF